MIKTTHFTQQGNLRVTNMSNNVCAYEKKMVGCYMHNVHTVHEILIYVGAYEKKIGVRWSQS